MTIPWKMHKSLTIAVVLWLLVSAQGHAEITLDGTMGPSGALSGPDYLISVEMGRQAGANLFHSFGRFDILTGQSATFSGPDTIANVVSRVTGGEISTIDGLLRSEVGAADFYFINPAGIVFGPGARVDVPAAFHAGTADEVRFADGAVFSAIDTSASTLSAAAPESFGYLGSQAGDLVINGSQLEFASQSVVSLSGMDVTIQGDANGDACLLVPGGRLHIAAVGAATSELPLSGALNPGTGILEISHADIATSGDGGGALRIGAGTASITSARLAADNTGPTQALGGVDIRLTGNLAVNASRIQANAIGKGASGGIHISADDLSITRQGAETLVGLISEVEPGDRGRSGDVDVHLEGKLTLRGAVGIRAYTFGGGDAGDVNIQAKTIDMDGQNEAISYRDATCIAGIDSVAAPGSTGHAGKLAIDVQGDFSVINGGGMSTSTHGLGNAGSVSISAGNFRIDGQGSLTGTGVSSQAAPGSVGNAGNVEIAVDGLLELVNGGIITSSTFGEGNAGTVSIAAVNLSIDGQDCPSLTGISSQAAPGSVGNAGKIEINTSGLAKLIRGGVVSSRTYSEGDAGGAAIRAGEIIIDRQGGIYSTGIFSDAASASTGDAGPVTVVVDGSIQILGGAAMISSNTSGAGRAGDITIDADRLVIDAQATGYLTGVFSNAVSGQCGDAGKIIVNVADLAELKNGGSIRTTTSSTGHAGDVEIAAGDLLEVINGGIITSSTFGEGHAGTVIVSAENLRIDGRGAESVTGISSNAGSASGGDAGTVRIKVSDLLELVNGGVISSATFSRGDAGEVFAEAGRLSIDGQGSEAFTGIASTAEQGSAGNAGMLWINVSDLLEMKNGGEMTSSTFSAGDAGDVRIEAGNLAIDGRGLEYLTAISSNAYPSSGGDAGMVWIKVSDLLELLDGGQISTSTFSQGQGGNVLIEAGSLRIDGQGPEFVSGVLSTAESGAAGNAGTVEIAVSDLLEVLGGGRISSSTKGEGDGGDVSLTAGEVVVAGSGEFGPSRVESLSSESAQGLAGNVTIQADSVQIRNGEISIASLQTVPEERRSATGQAAIHLNSTMLTLDQDARITAQSTGNAPAAAITIDSYQIELSGGSRITTSAVAANGGPIVIGADVVVLSDSLVTSSVDAAGDGGDITITGHSPARAVVLDGGFVQANAPAGARGGDIFIDAEALIAEPGSLEVGGRQRQVFMSGSGRNIIQAAAPGGEQGDIEITSPDLDISGSLVNLEARLAEPLRLADDPCQAAGETGGSALVRLGPGGVAAAPEQHGAVCFDGQRLDRLLRERKW